jgi:hypothetical protein
LRKNIDKRDILCYNRFALVNFKYFLRYLLQERVDKMFGAAYNRFDRQTDRLHTVSAAFFYAKIILTVV